MERLSGNNREEAVSNLLRLRRWKPFQYGGKWFVASFKDGFRAYRKEDALKKAAWREGAESVTITLIEKS